MFDDKAVEQILQGTKESGKTYVFDDQHNENIPSRWWFQKSEEGLILFVIFYTQACRWSRCLSCNLPSTCASRHIGYKAIINQIDYIFQHPEIRAQRLQIKKVIVSNNGSVLDQKTFSSMALMHLIVQLNLNLSNLAVLCLETRPEYVEVEELEFLARGIAEGDTPTELELAIGFEVFDERLRNEVLKKGLRLANFEKLVAQMAPYKYHLKCYVMQKPVPGMSDEEAVEDVRQALDYFGQVSRRCGNGEVKINVHLNPTYVAHGTPVAAAFAEGKYEPPKLRDVARAIMFGRNQALSIFVGLDDEGLAVPGGSFIRPGDEPLITALQEFNQMQDYERLQKAIA